MWCIVRLEVRGGVAHIQILRSRPTALLTALLMDVPMVLLMNLFMVRLMVLFTALARILDLEFISHPMTMGTFACCNLQISQPCVPFLRPLHGPRE